MKQRIVIAANNGEIGGGEVMLLAIAEMIRELELAPLIIGPSDPSGLVTEAKARGLDVEALPGLGRAGYMKALRRWRKRNPEGILWCNGLVPAVATLAMSRRVVHLHQVPARFQRPAAAAARLGSLATIVPSEFMAARIPGAIVLHNWSPEIERGHTARNTDHIRIGYLGRISEAKGVHILANAFQILQNQEPARYRLRLAGEPRFVDARERALVNGRLSRLGPGAQRIGWTPPAELFSEIDILVVPSVVRESFGLVVTEAMSASVPVVVTDAGALPEVVGYDHPWIADAGDAENLAEKIFQATSAFPAEEIVERAHQRWVNNFSPRAGRDRLRTFLSSLMQEGGKR